MIFGLRAYALVCIYLSFMSLSEMGSLMLFSPFITIPGKDGNLEPPMPPASIVVLCIGFIFFKTEEDPLIFASKVAYIAAFFFLIFAVFLASLSEFYSSLS